MSILNLEYYLSMEGIGGAFVQTLTHSTLHPRVEYHFYVCAESLVQKNQRIFEGRTRLYASNSKVGRRLKEWYKM